MPQITEYMSTAEVAAVLECKTYEVAALLSRHLNCRFKAGKKLSRGRNLYYLTDHPSVIFGEYIWDYRNCADCKRHREEQANA